MFILLSILLAFVALYYKRERDYHERLENKWFKSFDETRDAYLKLLHGDSEVK